MTGWGYVRDAPEIYRRSFEIIRSEADLSGIPAGVEPVVVRMMHACGMVDLGPDLAYSPEVGDAARAALRGGAPVLADSHMVANGVSRRRLPADNAVRCTLGDPEVPALAERLGTTRTAASVDLWLPHLEGAVVTIGNAPTALFRLLELLRDGVPRPAAIFGLPVGFVGAAESKAALAAFEGGVPFLTLHGRRGGSAMAAAAVNAVASDPE